jgi:hypothetical protein
MLQRETIGKVSLRHVEEGEQGAGVDSVCVRACVFIYWNANSGTFQTVHSCVWAGQFVNLGTACVIRGPLDSLIMTFILPI